MTHEIHLHKAQVIPFKSGRGIPSKKISQEEQAIRTEESVALRAAELDKGNRWYVFQTYAKSKRVIASLHMRIMFLPSIYLQRHLVSDIELDAILLTEIYTKKAERRLYGVILGIVASLLVIGFLYPQALPDLSSTTYNVERFGLIYLITVFAEFGIIFWPAVFRPFRPIFKAVVSKKASHLIPDYVMVMGEVQDADAVRKRIYKTPHKEQDMRTEESIGIRVRELTGRKIGIERCSATVCGSILGCVRMIIERKIGIERLKSKGYSNIIGMGRITHGHRSLRLPTYFFDRSMVSDEMLDVMLIKEVRRHLRMGEPTLIDYVKHTITLEPIHSNLHRFLD